MVLVILDKKDYFKEAYKQLEKYFFLKAICDST